MQNFPVATADILFVAVIVIAITAWSLHTLDRDRIRVEKLHSRGKRLPWRFRHFAGKSKQDLQASLVGKGIAFFIMLIGFLYLKTMSLSLGSRLLASAAICLIVMTTIPNICVSLARRIRKTQETDSHSG